MFVHWCELFEACVNCLPVFSNTVWHLPPLNQIHSLSRPEYLEIVAKLHIEFTSIQRLHSVLDRYIVMPLHYKKQAALWSP